MAFKTFNDGDILTGSEVNTYLMEQAVIRCTSGTRPGSPAEGMTIYETDTNRVYVYDGAAWKFVFSTTHEELVVVEFTPSTADATVGTVSYADWIATGNVTAPAWSTKAYIDGGVAGIFDKAGSSNNEYRLRWQIGSDVATATCPAQGTGDSKRFGVSWRSHIDLTSTGALAFDLQAIKVAGTDVLRCDAFCLVSALIHFLP